MVQQKIVIPILSLLFFSCSISDKDRCDKGQVYDSQYGGCRGRTPFDDRVTKAEGVDTGAGILNLYCNPGAGETCAGNGELDFCMLGPDYVSGVCTKPNCTTGSCQSADFACCDCSKSPTFAALWPIPICGVAEYAGTFEDYGCNCSNVTGGSTDTDPPDTSGGVVGLQCNTANGHADCASNGNIDYCLPNGMDPSLPGTCVQDDCTADNCPTGTQCCDCTSQPQFGWPSPLCTEDAFVDYMTGCVCSPNTGGGTDTATDSDTDSGSAFSCATSADCATKAPRDYCLPNALDTAQPGICVQDECTAGGCETGFQCCDCSSHPEYGWPSPLCTEELMVAAMEGAGCTCPIPLKECTTDTDCTGNGTMTTCLPNTIDTAVDGNCVQSNCTVGGCPAGQQCCDCSAVAAMGWPSPLCWLDAYITGDFGVETAGCTCE
ncbi:MAG: hypothetical protein JXR76_06875 [Deltaproteobacteria bacterium]|nr:hypothetical protein [Deltaproteobacteria bacterium]